MSVQVEGGFCARMRAMDSRDWRRFTVVMIGLFGYLAEGINASVISPFFPVEAQQKGANYAEIGLVIGIFDLSIVISSFFLSVFNRPQTQKYFYCSGMAISAVCVALFGTLDYGPNGWSFIFMCTLTRVVMGYGAGCVYSSTVPIVTQGYDSKYLARVTAVIQTALGLGVVIGPPFGSLFFYIGGYTLPFYCAAGVELTLFVVALFVVPGFDPKCEYETKTMDVGMFVQFIKTPKLWAVSLPLIALCATAGFRDTTFATFLNNDLGVSESEVGLIFLAISLSFAMLAPVFGALIEKGYAGYVTLYGIVVMPITLLGLFFIHSCPKLLNVGYVIFDLILNGTAVATAFGPGYLMFEKIAEQLHLTRDRGKIRLMVAGWYSICRSGARVFGCFVLGGLMNDAFGFYYSCLVISVSLVVCGCLSLYGIYVLGFFNKTFYTTNEEFDDMLKSRRATTMEGTQTFAVNGTYMSDSKYEVAQSSEVGDPDSMYVSLRSNSSEKFV